jgi:hypothetical protein
VTANGPRRIGEEHHGKLLLRIDPEHRPLRAAPEKLAGRARYAGDAGLPPLSTNDFTKAAASSRRPRFNSACSLDPSRRVVAPAPYRNSRRCMINASAENLR